MPHNRKLKIAQACEEMGVARELLAQFIEQQWISPERIDAAECELDDEDIARGRLIAELEALGVNAEAIPVVLHLLDQLYALRERLRQESRSRAAS